MHLSKALLGAMFCLASMTACLAVRTGAALAQPGGGQGPKGAGTDTTAMASTNLVPPTYNSTYRVERQAATWSQVFRFRNQWNGITVDNSTNYTIQTDAKTANFLNRSGDANTTLSFTVANQLPLSLNLDYSRVRSRNTATDGQQNTLDSSLRGSYNARPFRGAATTLDAAVGLISHNTSNNYSGSVGGTRELGLTQDIRGSGTYNGPFPGMSFKLNSSFKAVRNSVQTFPDTTKAPPPPTNTQSTLGLTWTWLPWNGWSTDATLNRSQSNQQYILGVIDRNQTGKQEVAHDLSSDLTTNIGFKPAGGKTDLSFSFYTNSINSTRKVQVERARQASALQFETKVRQQLLGNTIYVDMMNRTDDQNSIIMGQGTTLNRLINGYIDRPWTPALTTHVVGEIRLLSYKYADGKQDYDDLKKRVEATTNYSFWSKFTANLNARWVGDEKVLIDVDQSRGSQYEETYGAGATITYAMSARTSITQKYDFIELFTSKRFDPAASSMQRGRTVTTTVTTGISSKVGLTFTHNYFFQELGGYRRDASGTRYFSRGTLKYRQDLATSVTYNVTDWLSFGTDERLSRNDDIKLRPRPEPTSRAQITFTQRGTLKRPIPGGGNFTCELGLDIQKFTRSLLPVQKHFRAQLTLDKSF